MKSSPCHELVFHFPQDPRCRPDAVAGLLLELGVDAQAIVETRKGTRSSLSVYDGSRARLVGLSRRISAVLPRNVRVSVRKILERDWRDRWKKDFKAFALTRRLQIVPAWERINWRESPRKPIFMDTSLAFGTGLHETTRFTAGLIESLEGRFVSFLDVGTGTGILAMVAREYGAKKIFAFDNDPRAVKVARKNFLVNKCKGIGLKASSPEKFTKRNFDLVAANLITDDLLAFRSELVRLTAPGGWLVVSGISLKSWPRFRRDFHTEPLVCRKVQKGKEWVAALYQRTKSNVVDKR